MPADRRDVDRTLTSQIKLRFQRQEGSGHTLYTLVLSGQHFARTVISRGSSYRTLDDSILAKVARQVYLQPVELRSAIQCTINWPDYANILRQKFPADADKIAER